MNSTKAIILFTMIVLLLISCSGEKENQVQGCKSSSGEFKAYLFDDGEAKAKKEWRLEIHTNKNATSYVDANLTMSIYHQVYWQWDAGNKLWLMSSDDGKLFSYELDSNHKQWVRKKETYENWPK